MLEKYVYEFVVAADTIRQVERALLAIEKFSNRDILAPDDPTLASVERNLRMLRIVIAKVPGMRSMLPEINRIIETSQKTVQVVRIRGDLERLIQRIMDELDGHKFLYVSPSAADLYEAESPFGPSVLKSLPRFAFDIDEGAKCLALGRSTACVFHLMRVMEQAVQRFGQKLRITPNPNKGTLADQSWHDIMVEVEKAIGALPRGSRRQKLADTAAHLGNVRIAWRNETMHPRATYTHEEALAIWRGVDSFVRSFQRLLGR